MRALVWLISLVALGAVAFFTIQIYRPVVEEDLQQRSSAALAAAGLSFAKVDVAGRVVRLSGEAPSPTAKEDAVKVAGDVWGVRNVDDALVVNAAAAQPLTPQTVIGHVARISSQPAVAPTQHKDAPPPADAEPVSTALPTVEAMIDPSLAPPGDLAPAEPSPPPDPVARAVHATPAPSQTAVAAIARPAPMASAEQPLKPKPAAKGARAGLTAAAPRPAAVAPATSAIVAPPVYRLDARLDGKHIELQGVVSTPSAQRALVAHVRRHVRRADVVDSLTVAHTKPDRDWLGVARKGLSQLAHLDAGSLRLEGRTVALSGRPKSENDRASVLAALSDLPRGYTSTVLLERTRAPPPNVAPAVAARPVEAPKHVAAPPSKPMTASYRTAQPSPTAPGSTSGACRRRFSDLLPRMAVVFDSGSSRFQSTAAPALDEFASIARSCPGARVRLTGHSDTQEAPPASTRLSRERALAVREALAARGVSRASMSVAASGGTRPAFSNDTDEGRENNRRVEFAVW